MKTSKVYSRWPEARRAIALTVAAAFLTAASADTPEDKGFEIAARSDRSDRGFADNVAAPHAATRAA